VIPFLHVFWLKSYVNLLFLQSVYYEPKLRILETERVRRLQLLCVFVYGSFHDGLAWCRLAIPFTWPEGMYRGEKETWLCGGRRCVRAESRRIYIVDNYILIKIFICLFKKFWERLLLFCATAALFTGKIDFLEPKRNRILALQPVASQFSDLSVVIIIGLCKYFLFCTDWSNL
jgi:hypothetical protein